MSIVPNYYERQFMQQLRGRGWVNATGLPPGRSLIQSLLQKKWIESEGTGKSLAFKLTEEGLAAKKAPIPVVKWRRKSADRNSEVVQRDEGVRLHQAG
jgi:hypothetical protein